jgi:hypothetical protein
VFWSSAANVSYQVSRNGGASWENANGTNGASHTYSGLTPGTQHTVLVRGVNPAGRAGLPGSVSATTPISAPILFFSDVRGTSLTINWYNVTGANSFRVRRNSGNWIPVSNLTTTSYTFTGLTPGTSHFIEVEVMGSAASAVSSMARATNSSYVATVNHYFDRGYTRFYYADHGIANTTAAMTEIIGYMQAVAVRYLTLFNLNVTHHTFSYDSAIDICKGRTITSGNLDTFCAHPNPHTTLFNPAANSSSPNPNVIHMQFSGSYPGSNIVTNAYWSCHRIKPYETSSANHFNRSYSYINNIYMLERSTSNRVRDSQGILMHELNHQYGGKDHYHEIDPNTGVCRFAAICSECSPTPRPNTCIMFQSRRDITASDIICSSCQEDIKVHLNLHH